ncbi:hypothetical protein LA080_005453 [Diaporthe eres]|nr:hypothetical protein LA080_005453 [Diaporthe eres]
MWILTNSVYIWQEVWPRTIEKSPENTQDDFPACQFASPPVKEKPKTNTSTFEKAVEEDFVEAWFRLGPKNPRDCSSRETFCADQLIQGILMLLADAEIVEAQ